MVDKVELLYEKAMTLSEAERARLRELLDRTADGGFATPEIERAWIEEARRRDELVDKGEEALIPAEEVMRELRERYGV